MNRIKSKVATAVFLAVSIVLCGIMGFSTSVMADGEYYDGTYLLKRTLALDLYSCYTNGYIKQSVDKSDFLTIGDLISEKKENDGDVKLPNGLTSIKDDDLKCSELFEGYKVGSSNNSFPGILNYANSAPPVSDVDNFLTTFGYTVDTTNPQLTRCAYIVFNLVEYKGGRGDPKPNFRTNQICAYVDNNDNIVSYNGRSFFNREDGATKLGDFSGIGFQNDGTFVAGNSVTYSPCTRGDNFSQCINGIDLSQTITAGNNTANGDYAEFSNGVISLTGRSSEFQTYSISSFAVAGSNAMRSLFGNNSKHLSTPEVVSLYQIYLNNYADVQCTGPASEYFGPFRAIVNGEYIDNCYAKQMKSLDGSDYFYGYENSKWGASLTFSDVVDALKNLTVSQNMLTSVVSLNVRETNGELIDPNTLGDESDGDSCFTASSDLGWILCPIIKTVAEATEGLYDGVVEPFLAINVSAFDTSGTVYEGWQVFQTIANMIFVILFLVTIFSQITGVGIDNYGIKRLLPKLIIAAVLVNLSYIICMVLVDVSNIVGYGAKSFFDGLGVDGQSAGSAGRTATTTIVSAIAGAGLIGTANIWVPGLVLPIIMTLISLFFSILFAFILLAVRQAGVIICVVIAPVAFVLYMLPNTKPLFDRWRKIFTQLLLLFPLCGLLMGGAGFAGEIIAKSGEGFWLTAIGSLLSVVVFFFIPTLLRSSMSAMGNIGARISNLGQGVSRNAQQRAGNSQWAKDYETRRAAGVNSRGEQTGWGRLRGRIAAADQNTRLGRFMKATGLQRMASVSQIRGIAAQQKMLDEMEIDPSQLEAEGQARRFNRRVEASKSANVADGSSNRIGFLRDSDFADGGRDFEEGTLAYKALNASTEEERYAAMQQLLASGHHGETAAHQVMQTMAERGDWNALQSAAKAVKSDRNFNNLKSGARSTYDFVNAIANGDLEMRGGRVVNKETGKSATPDDYISKVKFDKMNERTLIGTNEEELNRYIASMESGNMSAEKVEKLQSVANRALANDRLRGDMKDNVEVALRRITAYQPPTSQNATQAANSATQSNEQSSTPATAGQGNAAPNETFTVSGSTGNETNNNPNNGNEA